MNAIVHKYLDSSKSLQIYKIQMNFNLIVTYTINRIAKKQMKMFKDQLIQIFNFSLVTHIEKVYTNFLK